MTGHLMVEPIPALSRSTFATVVAITPGTGIATTQAAAGAIKAAAV
jgi:hypothetical protein